MRQVQAWNLAVLTLIWELTPSLAVGKALNFSTASQFLYPEFRGNNSYFVEVL